jgi:GNAT superfamily N-acetyltransferase
VAVRYEVVEEADLDDERRRLACELLVEAFGDERARGRGWILHEPEYRILAWDGAELVGHETGCLLECEPELRVYGYADAAVREGLRGAGIARRLGEHNLEQSLAREADAALCQTKALERLVVSLGMRRVRHGELFHATQSGLRELFDAWFVIWFTEPERTLLIRRRF